MKYLVVVACAIIFFANCFDSTSKADKSKQSSENLFVVQGQEIAALTFATLSSNLQNAMKEGGVSNAVKYCNIAASPLVVSLEQIHKVKIKRTSLKVRNTNNQPTEQERQQLQKYQQAYDTGKALKPVAHEIAGQTIFYAPIRVMPMCQKCHGKVGEQLNQKDYELIKNLYPSDRAINYKSGDLRGMWSITLYEPKTDK